MLVLSFITYRERREKRGGRGQGGWARVPINRFPVNGRSRKRIWLICQADFTPVYVTVMRTAGRKGVRTVILPGANRQTLTIGNRFLRQRAPRRDVPGKKKFNGREKIALTIPPPVAFSPRKALDEGRPREAMQIMSKKKRRNKRGIPRIGPGRSDADFGRCYSIF